MELRLTYPNGVGVGVRTELGKITNYSKLQFVLAKKKASDFSIVIHKVL